jgi:hypothetical protein
MVLRDAGVQSFACEDFTVAFPAPEPAPVAPPTAEAAPAFVRTPAIEAAEQTGYDRLFAGNKPRLLREG